MKLFIEELVFCGVIPFCFFGGLSLIVVSILYALIPNLNDILERHGFDLGLFENYEEIKKFPAYAEHKQETVGIYTNGKFENPITNYSTQEKHLQEV